MNGTTDLPIFGPEERPPDFLLSKPKPSSGETPARRADDFGVLPMSASGIGYYGGEGFGRHVRLGEAVGVQAGQWAYLQADGKLTNRRSSGPAVGVFTGPVDDNGYATVKLTGGDSMSVRPRLEFF